MATVDPRVRDGETTGFVGSLADTPLAEVFRRIVSEERSGDLQVTTPEAIKTVYFDRGFVVFASSDRKSERLGESMIEAGRISRHEFVAASELMKTSRLKFGKALVSSGIVSEEELGHYVASQVNRIVLSLFSAKRGVYSFDERPTIIPMDLMVSLSVYRILMEGVRHMTSRKLVLTGLPSLDTDVALVDRPPFALEVEALRPVEGAVLTALENPRAIRSVADVIGGNEGVALRALYGLLAAGVLEARTSDPAKRPLAVQLETGTFVLSEISQQSSLSVPAAVRAHPLRVTGRRVSVTPASAPSPSPPSKPTPPAPVAPPPSFSPPPATAAAALEGDPEALTKAPAHASGFGGWITALWSSFLAWLGVSDSGAASELSIAPPVVRRTRPATPSARIEAPPAPPPAPPVSTSTATPTPTPAPPPAEAEAEEPEAPEVESIGVPSWSVVDAPEEKTSRVQASEKSQTPEWSVADNPAAQFQDFFEELGVAPASVRNEPTETEPTLPPAPRRESEAPEEPVIEMEDLAVADPDMPGELPEDDAPSMFTQIPVEEVALDEENVGFDLEEEDEVDIEIEVPIDVDVDVEAEVDAEEDEAVAAAHVDADAAVVARAEAEAELEVAVEPPVVPRAMSEPAAAAPPAAPSRVEEREPEPEPEEDESARLARDQARRRVEQAGGEGRLVRDVKLHFKLRDWEGAVPLLEQLLEISPGKALYRGMLGRALSRHPARRKEAEAQFIEALRLSPRDPEIHYWLGLYYKSFGLGARALNEFKTTVRINPKHEGARRQLGATGKSDDALGSVIKKIFG